MGRALPSPQVGALAIVKPMKRLSDAEERDAVERFARLPPAEQDSIMAAAPQIDSLDDLDGLSAADRVRLRSVIESQTAVP